jgi:hypothetical protein
MTKPRCYIEFCCNRATIEVVTVDRSGTGRDPIPWGYCRQHAPTERHARHAHPYSAERDGHNFSRARCVPGGRADRCVNPYCPRHKPVMYADYLARHATDSINPTDRDPWSGRS